MVLFFHGDFSSGNNKEINVFDKSILIRTDAVTGMRRAFNGSHEALGAGAPGSNIYYKGGDGGNDMITAMTSNGSNLLYVYNPGSKRLYSIDIQNDYDYSDPNSKPVLFSKDITSVADNSYTFTFSSNPPIINDMIYVTIKESITGGPIQTNNYIYLADKQHHIILRLKVNDQILGTTLVDPSNTSNNNVSFELVVGNIQNAGLNNTQGAELFNNPQYLATDGTYIYISDGNTSNKNTLIRRLKISDNTVTTLSTGYTDIRGLSFRNGILSILDYDANNGRNGNTAGRGMIKKLILAPRIELGGQEFASYYDSVITNLRYINNGDDPTDKYSFDNKTLSYSVIDSEGLQSNTVTRIIDVNTPPRISSTNSNIRYFEGEQTIPVDSLLLVTSDKDIATMTVKISSGSESGDSLLIDANQFTGSNVTLTPSTGLHNNTLTISDTNGIQVQAAQQYLRGIKYIFTKANATNTTKTIQITATTVIPAGESSGIDLLPNPYQYNIGIVATPAITVTSNWYNPSNNPPGLAPNALRINIAGHENNGPWENITLIRGNTYIFDVSDSTNKGDGNRTQNAADYHTLAFYSSIPGANTPKISSENGTVGSAGATVTLTVPMSGQLYFHSENHKHDQNYSNLGGEITVQGTAPNETGLVDRRI